MTSKQEEYGPIEIIYIARPRDASKRLDFFSSSAVDRPIETE